MASKFSLYCIDWQKGESKMLEARECACQDGLLKPTEVQADEMDKNSYHAMALSDNGKVIGCARIKSAGKVERLVVLAKEGRTQVEQALQLAALIHSNATSHLSNNSALI